MKKIRKTQEYKKFKLLKGNRPLVRSHINKIKKSIKEHDLTTIRPILVNRDYVILDGQYRFTALKELGKEINYIVTDDYLDLEEVQRINQYHKSWSRQDFLESWCVRGNPDYITFRNFMKKWGLTVSTAHSLLAEEHKHSLTGFKDGDFKIHNLEKAEKIARMVCDFEPYYKGCRRRGFVGAIKELEQHPRYNHKKMLKRAKAHRNQFLDLGKAEDYIDLLVKMHDHKTTRKNCLRTI